MSTFELMGKTPEAQCECEGTSYWGTFSKAHVQNELTSYRLLKTTFLGVWNARVSGALRKLAVRTRPAATDSAVTASMLSIVFLVLGICRRVTNNCRRILLVPNQFREKIVTKLEALCPGSPFVFN